jgi:hypothetical protein
MGYSSTPSTSTYITGGPVLFSQTPTSTTKFRFSGGSTSGRGVRIQNLILTATSIPIATCSLTNIVYNFTTDSLPTSTPANISSSFILRSGNYGSNSLVQSISPSSSYFSSSGGNNIAMTLDTTSFLNSYFSFTISPNSGFKILIDSINFGSRSTSTGPINYTIKSSFDGYSSIISSGVLLSNSTWVRISNLVNITTTSSITFRIYGYKYSSTTRTISGTPNWRIDDLMVNVLISNTPPTVTNPSTFLSIKSSRLSPF